MIKKKAESRVQKINPGLGNKRAEQRSIEAIKQAVVNEGKVLKPSKVSTFMRCYLPLRTVTYLYVLLLTSMYCNLPLCTVTYLCVL